MTLYSSQNDRALLLSRSLSTFRRAGELCENGEPLILNRVDSIDTSNVAMDFLSLNQAFTLKREFF